MGNPIARLRQDESSYHGARRRADLRRKRPQHHYTDSADGRALWAEFLEAHDGDPEAALGEVVAALLEAGLL